MRDLIPRSLTAIILLPLVISAIFWLPENYLFGVTAAIFMVAGWEWAKLSGLKQVWAKILYSVILLGILYVVYLWPQPLLYYLTIGGWGFALLGLVHYNQMPATFPASYGCVTGFAILPSCWYAINDLCLFSPRPYYLLTLFLLIWAADIVAYFVGCRFGKHKLAIKISPGKSIEGAVGALFFTVLLSVIIADAWHWQGERYFKFILLAVITVIASIIGDLFESMLKRQQGLKDSGRCLPGHGGLLDRIDSLTSAAPFFLLGLMWLRIF